MSHCNCNSDNGQHENCSCTSGTNSGSQKSQDTPKISAPSCSCGCNCHEKGKTAEKLQKYFLFIGTAVFILAVIMQMLSFSLVSKIFYIAAYLMIGFGTFTEFFEAFREKDFFGENTLMTVSTVGAMLIGEMAEGCIVMLLFEIGEILEHKAQSKSKDNIKKLLELKPKTAIKVMPDGTRKAVLPESLAVGDVVIVNAGDTLPCDGVVVEGCVNADTSSVTGESVPRLLEKGNEVRCGFISLDGSLTVKVSAAYHDNTFSKILKVITESGEKKSKSEGFVTKFARVYTPVIMALSLLVMLAGSIATGEISTWIYRGLVFLATSCPCAFVISVPLTFFFGIGEMTKQGLLVKGSEYVEKLSKTSVCVFDKTGTLTKGKLKIVKISPFGNFTEEFVMSSCAALEINSNHPIAREIVSFCENNNIEIPDAVNIREMSGKGICGEISGKSVCAGNEKVLKEKISFGGLPNTTKVYVTFEEKLCGVIELCDEIRKESAGVINRLYRLGVKQTVMLTGDNRENAEETAAKCGIDKVYSDLEPTDKAGHIENILKENTSTVYIGDGINDAPVLAMADVGIAVGNGGAEIAVENADAVILGTSLTALTRGIEASKTVMARVKFNVLFAIGIKLAIMLLTLFGFANMGLAVFGDVGVTILVILNSLRKFRYR